MIFYKNMESYKFQDDEYYPELQASLRSYDEKLWQIPALFSAVVALILGSIDRDNFLSGSISDTIVSFFGTLFLFLLILLFYKAHFFHVSIQKKINEFDKEFNKKDTKIKRIPLTSMASDELKDRLKNLKGDDESRFASNHFQEWLIERRVSSWMKFAMLLIFTLNFLFFIFSFVKLTQNNNLILNIWQIFF